MQLFKELQLEMTLTLPAVASIKSVAATRAEIRLPTRCGDGNLECD